jgi:glutathione S-transferase
MTQSRHIILYESPLLRFDGVLLLLEELNADYELHVLDVMAGETHKADYLAINPMGKVPAIKHGDVLVTEQLAIHLYLSELYPEAGLSPAVGTPLRGPYLRWMVFYGSCLYPALVDRANNREPLPPMVSPYGDFDTMLGTLTRQLAQGPWLLGKTFTAVDVLWGSALAWAVDFKLMPEGVPLVPVLPEIKAYLDRFNARPAVARVRAEEAELAETSAGRGRPDTRTDDAHPGA